MGRFLADLPLRWSSQRVLVIGQPPPGGAWSTTSAAPGSKLADGDFAWQAGWEYVLR